MIYTWLWNNNFNPPNFRANNSRTSKESAFCRRLHGITHVIFGFSGPWSNYRAGILNWQFCVKLRIHSKRENINFRVRRSSIFLVNQMYELKLCLARSLETATRSGQESNLKNRQFKITGHSPGLEGSDTKLYSDNFRCICFESWWNVDRWLNNIHRI